MVHGARPADGGAVEGDLAGGEPALPPGPTDRRTARRRVRRTSRDAAVAGPGRMRPRFARSWADDPPWATVYDWSVEHPHRRRPRAGGWRWAATWAACTPPRPRSAPLPAGSVVLDVPCGGGVALRGLRPGQGMTYLAVDIAQAMLDRTMVAARRRGVADQVVPQSGRRRRAAARRRVRGPGRHVHRPALLPRRRGGRWPRWRACCAPAAWSPAACWPPTPGVRYEPLRRAGRRAHLLGPMCSRAEVVAWFAAEGVPDVRVTTSGAIAYFRGVKA